MVPGWGKKWVVVWPEIDIKAKISTLAPRFVSSFRSTRGAFGNNEIIGCKSGHI